MNVVIIEDEKLLQQELASQLTKYSDIQIVNYMQSVEESILWLKDHGSEVDLIFMDIELADGICFEIFESLEVATPIIFLTAYSEYAIKAFKVNSIDYLLKPLNENELDSALIKFKKREQESQTYTISMFKEFYENMQHQSSDRLLIQSGDHFRYLELNNVAYFQSEEKYTKVIDFEKNTYLINDSLNKLEISLDVNNFFRVSRNMIVNISAIKRASKYFNSRLKLTLEPSPDEAVIISRVKVDKFLKWMGNKC